MAEVRLQGFVLASRIAYEAIWRVIAHTETGVRRVSERETMSVNEEVGVAGSKVVNVQVNNQSSPSQINGVIVNEVTGSVIHNTRACVVH